MHDAPSKPATDDAIQIAATVFAPGSRRLVWSSKNPKSYCVNVTSQIRSATGFKTAFWPAEAKG